MSKPGERIRDIRSRRGLSQPRFARAVGIGLANLRDIEQGRTQPSLAVRTLVELFDRHPDEVRRAARLGREWDT